MVEIVKPGLVTPDGRQITAKKARAVKQLDVRYQGGFAALNYLNSKDAEMVAEVIICQAAKTRMLGNYGADAVPSQEQATQAIFETIAAFIAGDHIENFDVKSGYILMGPDGPEITAPVMIASETGFALIPKSRVVEEVEETQKASE